MQTIAYGSRVKPVEVRNQGECLVEIGIVCYDVSIVLPILQEAVEMTDEELRALALQSKTYDFWNNKADGIYSISDGTPL